MRRMEQKEKRRQEILEAGLDLFIRKGYAATKTLDISHEAGMSEGLLFHYFETKEKLYEELIKLGTTGPQNLLDSIKEEPLAYFETAAKQIFHYIKTVPFVAKMFVLMKQARSSEGVPESVKKIIAEIDSFTPSVNKIKEGQACGTIREGDPVALALAFWAAIQGIAEQAALFPHYPVPDSEWIVDILRKNKKLFQD